MLDRWERILGATLSLLLVLGALVASRQPGGSLAPAYAAGSWSGASAPGSGQAPWETFDQGVNVATGNLLVEGDGVAFPQINGMDLAVAPVYNSLSKGVTTDLGHGWLLGTGRDVGLVFGSGVVTFYDGTGHGWAFSSPGSCVFTPPAGIDAQLACSGSNYLLTDNVSGAQLQFDANGYLTAARNRVGNQVSFTYDANGRLTQITGPVSPGTQYVTVSYNAQNLISQVRDPNGRTWGYGYSAAGDLTGVTDPAGNVWQYAYDATHTLTRITDARGNYSLFTYDGAGRVSTIVDVTNTGTNTGPNWTVTYPSGSSTQVTDPNNHTTTYGFDGAGPVTSIIHPDSTVTQATWTADNHLATVQLPSGATTTYSYDSLNNLTKVTYPSGAHEDWVYGDSGHPYLPTVYYDPQGNPRSFSYNPNGTLAVTGDATGHTASLAYNGDGTVQSVTDENGHVTGYGYTALGLPSSTTYPGPRGAESYSYNADNLLSSETDGKGQTTTHSYDALGQETSLGSADGSAVGSSYDANGNEIQM
ncbi:MAG: RHS repeat protein, partial [Chloroflexi bacterium]|nr:RHS repeat protein [Chloroflexota bacterium]